jgi:hypothetical protein
MRYRRLVPALVLPLLAVPASAGAALPEEAAVAESDAAQAAVSRAQLRPGRVIRTRRSWECSGPLRNYGRVPIKVISNMPNRGTATRSASSVVAATAIGGRST